MAISNTFSSKQFADRVQDLKKKQNKYNLVLLKKELDLAKHRYEKLFRANGGKFDADLTMVNKEIVTIEKGLSELQDVADWQDHAMVGNGVSVLSGRDSHAYTIIEMHGQNRMVIQRDIVKPIDTSKNKCALNDQQYEYEKNPKGEIKTFTFRKSGLWVEAGRIDNGERLLLRGRREFYDYND